MVASPRKMSFALLHICPLFFITYVMVPHFSNFFLTDYNGFTIGVEARVIFRYEKDSEVEQWYVPARVNYLLSLYDVGWRTMV